MKNLSKGVARKLFEAQLRRALTYGKGADSDEGLNGETMTALNAVANAYPNPTDAQIQTVRKAFDDWQNVKIDMNALSARYS